MSDYQPRRPDVKQFITILAIIGVVIAVGLMLWLRQSSGRELAILDGKLAAAEALAGTHSAAVRDLQDQLSSAETTVTALTERNAALTADVARLQAEIDARNAKPVITVTGRSVSPAIVVASNSLDLSVSVKGRATKVQMKLVGPAGNPDSQIFDLVRYSTDGAIDTWHRSMTAPWKPGEYKSFGIAYIGDQKYEMAGDPGFSFTVQ